MSISYLSKIERILEPCFHIDPGFINKRLCVSVLGDAFIFVQQHLKPEIDHWTKLYNNHILVHSILEFCKNNKILPYQSIIRDENLNIGSLWSSIETLKGVKKIYEINEAKNQIILPKNNSRKSFLEFHTSHFVADTGKLEQSEQRQVSIIAKIDKITDTEIISRPLLMGAPTFDYPSNSEEIRTKLSWWANEFYEIMPEDIAEFNKIETIDANTIDWLQVMGSIPEEDVKKYFCDILGDLPQKDWGGELNDHFTSSITLGTTRKTAAFIFKGPARFEPMLPKHLGKNGDQIFRLSQSPAQVLFVQHCHNIDEAVRAQLRAFAVTPHNPRHYCLIDGKDTYRIFKAYNKI